MASRRHTAQLLRWAPILQSVILALGLLALATLDYVSTARNIGLIAAVLALLVLLSVLFLRLSAQVRQAKGRVAFFDAEPLLSARTAVLTLAGLTVLAAALRFYGLGDESFWYDETWTAVTAAQPLSSVLQSVNPLAHVIAHWTMTISRSEFALRLGPALAGVALIPAVYLLGRTLYGRSEGLVAAAFITLSVHAVYHSQELRFYAWQMLFPTLSFYFLLRGLERPRWRDWAGFALTTMLNLYSHPSAFFVLASQGIYTLGILVNDELFSPEATLRPWQSRIWTLLRRSLPPGAAALLALAAFLPFSQSLFRFYNPDWVLDMGPAEMETANVVRLHWISFPIGTWFYHVPCNLLSVPSPFYFPLLVLFLLGLLTSTRRRIGLVLVWILLPLPACSLSRSFSTPAISATSFPSLRL